MFLVDKYAPICIEESKFHNDIFKLLQHISKNDSIPHILLIGSSGVGKKTAIKLLLEMLYDSDVHDTEDTIYPVVGSGNKTTDVIVKQSNYHIVIEPNNNNFDRYLIQYIVKEYAKNMSLGVFKTNKMFRTVLINNIDNMSYYAQTSLRRTMEKYSSTCRFIMWCTSLTRVIEPLISRTMHITLKAPTDKQMFTYLLDICYKENIHMDAYEYNEVITKADSNIKEALWILEKKKIKYNDKNTYHNIIDIIVAIIINHDINQICRQKSIDKSDKLFLRDLLYDILITNISGSKILKDLLNKLLTNKDLPDECKYKIIDTIAYYEYCLINGRRMIVHLEAAVIKIMKIIYDYEKNHPEYKKIFKKYETLCK